MVTRYPQRPGQSGWPKRGIHRSCRIERLRTDRYYSAKQFPLAPRHPFLLRKNVATNATCAYDTHDHRTTNETAGRVPEKG